MPAPSNKSMPLAGQVIVVFFMVAMFLPLIGSTFINKQIAKEQGLILQWYGSDKGEAINARADGWFRLWAIRSGLMQSTIHAFDPKTSEQQAEQLPSGVKPIVVRDSKGKFGAIGEGEGEAGEGHQGKWYWWITAVFALCYFAMLRLSTFLVWIPILVPVCVAILATGRARQRLKWHGFGGVNPLQYRAGIRMSGWMFGIGLGMFFSPGALPPITVAACLLLSISGVAMVMANRQKPT